MSEKPRMLYFGPWERSGHFWFNEDGRTYGVDEIAAESPWNPDDAENGIDCQLQPGCYRDKYNHWKHDKETEGAALLHHKAGWTALSFWDRTVDRRGGCNSTYIAEGIFTFEQMVEMAKTRFAKRWNRMKFEVRLV
jgi:hypothetical protein